MLSIDECYPQAADLMSNTHMNLLVIENVLFMTSINLSSQIKNLMNVHSLISPEDAGEFILTSLTDIFLELLN